MPDITIRRLGAADLQQFRVIRLEALQQAPDAFGSDLEAEAARPIEYFRMRLASSLVLGLFEDDRIAGMAGLLRLDGVKERHKAYLWGVYVRAQRRRQGSGAALVEAVIGQAPDGVEQILLTVGRANAGAFALYERLGFSIYGVEPRALKSRSGYLDEALMVKFLR